MDLVESSLDVKPGEIAQIEALGVDWKSLKDDEREALLGFLREGALNGASGLKYINYILGVQKQRELDVEKNEIEQIRILGIDWEVLDTETQSTLLDELRDNNLTSLPASKLINQILDRQRQSVEKEG